MQFFHLWLAFSIAIGPHKPGWAGRNTGPNNSCSTDIFQWTYRYSDVIMSAMASLTTGVSIVCSTVCSGTDQRKHQSSASLAFVRGIYRWPMTSPHKWLVMRKMFPFDDVIMNKNSDMDLNMIHPCTRFGQINRNFVITWDTWHEVSNVECYLLYVFVFGDEFKPKFSYC